MNDCLALPGFEPPPDQPARFAVMGLLRDPAKVYPQPNGSVLLQVVQFVGGTAAVTKVFGSGVTVTYVSTGLVDITWSANQSKPGTFLGPQSAMFHATTQATIKAYSCVTGNYSVSARTLRVNMYDASNNLVDLAALQWLTLMIAFLTDGAIGP